MKRYGNLWPRITDAGNIEAAFERAAHGKHRYRAVCDFTRDAPANLVRVRASLLEKTFHTAPYREKTVYEPKQRTIYVLPFAPDRIVQHALMNVIAPLWESFFIEDSYACRVGKGIHAGSRRAMEFVRRNKYCLKCDIHHFYPSVDHEILFSLIELQLPPHYKCGGLRFTQGFLPCDAQQFFSIHPLLRSNVDFHPRLPFYKVHERQFPPLQWYIVLKQPFPSYDGLGNNLALRLTIFISYHRFQKSSTPMYNYVHTWRASYPALKTRDFCAPFYKEIVVLKYRVKPTKYVEAKAPNCIMVQFYFADEAAQTHHVFFSGSSVLIGQMEKHRERLPFRATVRKVGKYFTFT